MSSLAAFAAVAAVVGVSLPEQISAAGTSVATTQEVQVQAENAAQEQALAAPSKAAPSVVMPALGVALLLTLSTTLFLLLRCIQSRASPDREGAVNVRNLSAGGDEEDPCKELEEKLAEGFDESLITGGPDPDTKFYTLEDLKREGLYETILLPEPDPARDVGLAEAEEIIDAMEKVLKFIEEGEQSDKGGRQDYNGYEILMGSGGRCKAVAEDEIRAQRKGMEEMSAKS
ncbi:hypothetical protein, conserved [Eimeria brunetti]|uniref:Uncharacterized protein n=1 Tax=Eimeria brunetti TaxID=51314 RepID=U6LA03_9EIME|nr:hypothetical protein, conserved [Eimeria brunetti]